MRRNAHAGRVRRDGVEFRVLTDDDLADIHLGTLEVLERTGVFVEDEEAREVFAGAGATVDARGVVRIPGHVVEQAVRTAPSKVVLAGRNPKNDIVLEAGRVGFTNFGEGVQIVDPYTGELRVPDQAGRRRHGQGRGRPAQRRRLRARGGRRGRRPARGAPAPGPGVDDQHVQARVHGLRQRLPLGQAPGDGRRRRRRPRQAARAAHHLVHHLSGEPAQAGQGHLRDHHGGRPRARRRQHPLDGDGRRLVAGDARRHAGHAQRRGARRPDPEPADPAGSAVVYGSSTTAMDLRLASASVGSPECGLINAAVAQIARFYLLPSWVAGA